MLATLERDTGKKGDEREQVKSREQGMGSREALSLETSEDFWVFYGPQASTSIGTQGSLRRPLQSDWGLESPSLGTTLAQSTVTSPSHLWRRAHHRRQQASTLHYSTLPPNSGRSWFTRGLHWLGMSLKRPPIVLDYCASCCPVSSVTVSAVRSSLFERMKP